jgi:DNA-binding SARP family transcriptional activator
MIRMKITRIGTGASMNGQSHLITLRLLKGFTLAVDHARIPVCSGTQRLVAFLALQGMPRSRAYVAGILWPDVTASRANASLRSSLWRAARTGHPIIDATARELALSQHIVVDLHEAVARAHRLLDSSRPCDDILTMQTLADLSVDLLPEWPENDWMMIAVAAGLAAVRSEPLRESAHRVLIKAHLAAGNRGAALRQFEQCRRVLREELGLEPSASLRDLVPLRTGQAEQSRLQPFPT